LAPTRRRRPDCLGSVGGEVSALGSDGNSADELITEPPSIATVRAAAQLRLHDGEDGRAARQRRRPARERLVGLTKPQRAVELGRTEALREQVRLLRAMISDVRTKGEPVKD
jgi:hypothetical protein